MGHTTFLSDNIRCKTRNRLTLLPPVLVRAYTAVLNTRTSRGTRVRSIHGEERKVHARVYNPARSAEQSLACHTPTRGHGCACCCCTSALETGSRRGLRHDADGSQVAETVSEAHARSRFLHGRSKVRIHSLGHLHIGVSAYGVWALPPTTGVDAMIETAKNIL